MSEEKTKRLKTEQQMEKEPKFNRNSTNWAWLVFYSKLSRQGQNKEANYFVGYKGNTFGLREKERETVLLSFFYACYWLWPKRQVENSL